MVALKHDTGFILRGTGFSPAYQNEVAAWPRAGLAVRDLPFVTWRLTFRYDVSQEIFV